MSKYFTQSESDVIGATEAGWTQLGGATTAHVPDYADYAVNPVKSRYLKLTPGGAGSFELLQYDACNADANRANFDICTLVIGALCTATTVRVAYARGQGSGTVTDHYSVSVVLSTGVITLGKRVASANSPITTATDSTTITPTSAWFARFRGNGTTLQVRVWPASLGMAGEPTTWAINTTDASLSAAGWIARGGFGAGLVTALSFFSVGTNGDTAPCPRTNAEFYDWANKPNQRCIIAELQATGYNSGASPYTKTINAYVSNLGYTSQQQDTPSLKHYDNYISTVPTFSRNMGEALTGPSQVGFGELVLKNPAVANSGAGRLDDWIRARWNRNYLRMFVGSRDWPRHDFRPIVTGRLGIPSAPSPDLIRFPIADLSDFFNVELSRNRFSSGDFINRAKQKHYGLSRCIELQVDSASKVATITDGFTNDMNDATYRIFDATGDGFTHIGGTKSATLAISSVDAAADTITANAAHNLQAGYRVRFSVGTVPTGLSLNTNYWVLAAGLTSTAFKVTATKGSTTPVDLTSGTGTANITSYGYTFSTSGTVEFVNLPVGRAFLFSATSVAGGSATATIRDIAFNDAGLSLNFKDGASFTAALATDTSAGDLHAPIDKGYTCRAALDLVAQRCRVWYGFSADGLLQTGAIGLPGSTAVRSFTSSDIKLAGVSLTKIDRPIDFTRTRIYTGPWYCLGAQPQISGVDLNGTNDPGTNSAELFSGHTATGAYTGYGAAGIPLDDHPDQTDSTTTGAFDTYHGDVTALVNFYKWPMGFFEIKTKFGALWTTSKPLSLGDTISLDYPRLGWKNYTGSDDLSPDNTGDYDARFAVVSGISVNLSAPPDEQVVLRVYRPVRGYFPAADLN